MAHRPADTVVRHLRRLAGSPRPADPADAQLLHQFVAARDEEAFASLVRKHARLIRGGLPARAALRRGRRGRLPGDS